MAKGTHYVSGFVCSKDRMLRGLPGCAKYNHRMAQIMATKRKIEELEMQREVVRLTQCS